eukprot:TRINITY_DN4849_c0_g2_i1.p1 TRINITY_DN4849_c0_g2~~TRINITY_DN4849_c0_g2_i1.p1  ORF type:complete len:101 (+),score=10.85 TRINITY_DN4849_c0_g2_i1:692-994(+)
MDARSQSALWVPVNSSGFLLLAAILSILFRVMKRGVYYDGKIQSLVLRLLALSSLCLGHGGANGDVPCCAQGATLSSGGASTKSSEFGCVRCVKCIAVKM